MNVQQTDPKGNVTLKTYDKAGRLSKVTADGETTVYSYLANGTRSKVTYPDGTTETYAYNKNSQVTVLINSRADGSELSYYRYTYDKAGNQLTKTEAKGTTVYTYDSLNRLGSVTEPGGRVTSYSYDKAGNRRTESLQNGAIYSNTLYTYDNQNRLLSTASTGGAFTRYYYDSNGNLINKITGIMKDITDPSNLTAEDLTHFGLVIKRESDYGTGSGDITSYTYDPYNRLTGYKAENTSASYQYNAQGYRVEKTVNGETTKYLYEADKVVLETDADNKQTAFQVYGTNLLYRSVASDADTDDQSYYYLYNAHGDVTELIDADGNIAVAYDYDAFGNLLSKTGEADNPARYAGYRYDGESGLYYLNARYYDSVTARFLSEDSYTGERNDPLSLNLYTYCSNNPIMYDDPSGHKKEDEKDKKDKTVVVAVAVPGIPYIPYVPNMPGMNGDPIVKMIAAGLKVIASVFGINTSSNTPVVNGTKANPYPAPTNPQAKSTTDISGKAATAGNATNSSVASQPVPGNPPKQESNKADDIKQEPNSPGSMQKQVEKGQAPKEVDRVDKPHVEGQKPHVHFKDGTSLNNDGTVHDAHKGTPNPSNKTIDWLNKNRWEVLK